jgi:L-lactate dehydrogenase complex protein LldG
MSPARKQPQRLESAGTDSARERILNRLRAATGTRPASAHPGLLTTGGPDVTDPRARLIERLQAAGAEVVELTDERAISVWLKGFTADFESAAVGAGVTDHLRPDLPAAPPEQAPLGVSLARAAIAETGSLLLDSREGRRTQLLPPTHLVWVLPDRIVSRLDEALAGAAGELPAALALHSGPSKSADIGMVTVQGVHGPGRLVVVLLPAVGAGSSP